MKDDIIKMAREAGLSSSPEDDNAYWTADGIEELERFAALVAARCADIAHEAEPFHSADLIREAFGVKQ
jgi:hypothetical protein